MLVLEIDKSDTSEGGIGFSMELKGTANVGRIEERMHGITLVSIEGTFVKMVSMDRDIDGKNG